MTNKRLLTVVIYLFVGEYSLVATDAESLVKTTLSDNWNNANTTNRTPLIDLIDDAKQTDVGNNNDYVLIFESSNTEENFSLDYKGEDISWTVTCDIRTANKTQRNRIIEEIRRLIHTNNVSTGSSYSTMKVESKRHLVQDQNKPFYQSLIVVRVDRKSVTIPES